MIRKTPRAAPLYFVLSLIAILLAIFLIWLGANVTTHGVGLIVPDWPQSYGSFNPQGWWQKFGVRLEHGHRLTAMLLGVFALALFLLSWADTDRSKKVGESGYGYFGAFLIVVIMGLSVDFARRAGAVDPDNKGDFTLFFTLSMCALLGIFVWVLAHSLRKTWHLRKTLSVWVLWAVILQAVMGGLRVTETSDKWAIAHGFFAQMFFCLLLAVAFFAFVDLQKKPTLKFGETALAGFRQLRNRMSIVFLLIVCQLLLGAMMRHTHRLGLPVGSDFPDDFPLMNGAFLPDVWNFALTTHFLHRLVGYVIFFYVAYNFFWHLRKRKKLPPSTLIFSGILFLIISMQVFLGIMLVLSGKNANFTNLHVINGLVSIATTFILSLKFYEKAKKQ